MSQSRHAIISECIEELGYAKVGSYPYGNLLYAEQHRLCRQALESLLNEHEEENMAEEESAFTPCPITLQMAIDAIDPEKAPTLASGIGDLSTHSLLWCRAAISNLLPETDNTDDLVRRWVSETLGATSSGQFPFDESRHFARWLKEEGLLK